MLLSTNLQEKLLSISQFLPLIWMTGFMHFDGKGDMLFVALVVVFVFLSLSFGGISIVLKNIKGNFWFFLLLLFSLQLSLYYILLGADSGFMRVMISTIAFLFFFDVNKIYIIKRMVPYFIFSIAIGYLYYIVIYNQGIARGNWSVNAIPFAYNVSVAIVISTALLFYFRGLIERFFLLLASLALVFALLLSGSRGPIFSMLLVGLMGFLFLIYKRKWKVVFLLLSILFLLTLISFTYFPYLFERIMYLSVELGVLSEGNFNTSVGYRLKMWIVGFEMLLEMPWYGYGKDALMDEILLLIKNGGVDENTGQFALNHFHNGYLDICLRYGYLGLLIFLLLVLHPIWWAKKYSSNDALFLLSSLCILQMLVNISEYNNIHPQSAIYFLVPIGVAILFFKDKNESKVLS
ncbi:O-antigen ligase family protein [Vibrio amylolyticus]|uniref:O-antigen ligase family protein n=1 Tax=Vibrio amylolyticus TaxID=2847292 RepID=UPI003551DA81